MKVVINKRYGGFGLSEKAYERLIALGVPVISHEDFNKRDDDKQDSDKVLKIVDAELTPKGTDRIVDLYYTSKANGTPSIFGRYYLDHTGISEEDVRCNPLIVQVVEELKEEANTRFSALKIVEIPDDVSWCIEEYDGMEWVREVSRTWD